MSIKVMDWVWQNSKQKGSALLLLLAIADHAHDDGDGAYPSVSTLAKKTRMSERQTQRILRDLTTTGELIIKENQGPNGCHLYRVTFCQGVTSCQGDKLSKRGDILPPGGGDKFVI